MHELPAFCALDQRSFNDILYTFKVTAADWVSLLARLDRIGIVELLPNNRFRQRNAHR